VSTNPTRITIPRPHVPYGPEGVDVDKADAQYLREAASKIAGGWRMGSNLTATVTKLLRDAATAIEGGDPTPEDVDALSTPGAVIRIYRLGDA
jgi:hypothetical protein